MLLKLRSYVLIILIIVSMIIYWPVPVLTGVFGSSKQTYKMSALWGRWVMFLLRYLVNIDYRVQGRENVPDSPCVMLSKHQSAIDIFIFMDIFDYQTWVFKKELLNIPFFGWMLKANKPIAIDRSQGRKALQFVMQRGKEKLEEGFCVSLYPEGTRTLPGQRGNYKSGGVMLAKRAGVDIVPIALNTGLFWQKGRGLVNSGTVDIIIGEPISTKDEDIKTLNDKIANWIEEQSLAVTLEHPHYLSMLETNKVVEAKEIKEEK